MTTRKDECSVLMPAPPPVLTIHPRYFRFYVFLLDEFWRRGLTAIGSLGRRSTGCASLSTASVAACAINLSTVRLLREGVVLSAQRLESPQLETRRHIRPGIAASIDVDVCACPAAAFRAPHPAEDDGAWDGSPGLCTAFHISAWC